MSKGKSIVKVECGSQFSVALSSNGSVYTWGKGDYHRLGHGADEHVRRPKKVMTLQGKKVISISTGKQAKPSFVCALLFFLCLSITLIIFYAGALHCVVCTDQGEVRVVFITHPTIMSWCFVTVLVIEIYSRSIHGEITMKVN